MFAEEILSVLGIAPFFIALCAALWKADEIVSDELRQDFSRWLKSSNLTRSKIDFVELIRAAFKGFYGPHYFSWRSLLAVAITGLLINSIFLVPLFLTGKHYVNVLFHTFTHWHSLIILSSFLMINIFTDYCSYLCSRFLFMKFNFEKRNYWIIILDFVASFSCVLLIAYILYIISVYIFKNNPGIFEDDVDNMVREYGSFQKMLTYLWDGLVTSFDRSSQYCAEITILDDSVSFGDTTCPKVLGLAINPYAAVSYGSIIATMVSSIWILLSLISVFLFRKLDAIGMSLRFVRYSLPVDKYPIRSIGIYVSILFLIISATSHLIFLTAGMIQLS